MKGNVRIVVSLFFGIVIILGGFYMRTSANTVAQVGSVITSQQEPSARQYITPEDADNNGISDWREAIPDKPSIDEAIAKIDAVSIDETSRTTTFARGFFQNYLLGTLSGNLTKENQAEFIAETVDALEKDTQDELYTKEDLILGGNTIADMHTYGNVIADITFRNSQESEGELNIFGRALKNDDKKILEALDPIITGYEAILNETLHTKVPSSLANEHLDLINVYNAILGDIKAFRDSFNDPITAAIRTRRYTEDAQGLYNAFFNIYSSLTEIGIHYTDTEPASLFDIGLPNQ